MSSQKYASPLRIELLPSRILLGIVLFAHLGAVGLLIPLAMPMLPKVLLMVLIIMSLAFSAYGLGWEPAGNALSGVIGRKWPRFNRALWDHDDFWQLTDEHEKIHQACLMPTTLVHPHLVVLNLRLSGQPWYCRYRSIILLRDNIDSETFRRLRIRLRWYAPPADDSSAVLK